MHRQIRFTTALLVMASATALHAAAPVGGVVERDPAGGLVLRWTDANPVDVFASPRADATPASATLVSRADADGQEAVADAGPERRYFILRDTRSGKMSRVAERVLPLERGSNFRDLGGYETAGGRHVRWGLIYRSGATALLADGDVARVKALGLADIIDLRSSEERVLAPTRLTGIRYSAIDYSMLSMMGARTGGVPADMFELYRNMPAFLAPHLRIVFGDLVAQKGPIMFHCSAGQDRTGVTVALILSALGVPRDRIIADYHLSTTYRRPENEMPVITPAMAETNPVARMFAGYQSAPGARTPTPLKNAEGRAFLEGAFAEIDARWGSVDGYLKGELGLTERDLRRLRTAYTE